MFNIFKKKIPNISEPVITLLQQLSISDNWAMTETRTHFAFYIKFKHINGKISIDSYLSDGYKIGIRNMNWLTNDERKALSIKLIGLNEVIRQRNKNSAREQFAKDIGC